MSTPGRLVAFVAGLGIVFGLGFFVGGFAGPDVETERHDADHGRAHEAAYRLQLVDRHLRAGPDRTLRFALLDADGDRVTAYTERHEKDLHLIVVATENLADFQHLHPRLDSSGLWSVELDVAPGRYRLYADTQPEGAEPTVVEADLRATGGRPVRAELRSPAATTRVGPYAVRLAQDGTRVTFTVTRNGVPVTDLEPYLGAYGHLVAIRADDLAYLHAHPEDGPAGPGVAFEVELERSGRHALYLDFQHDGVVRTARFALDVESERSGGHDGH
jgi:hypothetical protein